MHASPIKKNPECRNVNQEVLPGPRGHGVCEVLISRHRGQAPHEANQREPKRLFFLFKGQIFDLKGGLHYPAALLAERRLI
jgi:hypothetical protein